MIGNPLKNKWLMSVLVVVSFCFCINLEVQANEKEILFNFQTVSPKNQRTEGNYFDLEVAANDKQELIVILNNLSDEDLTINPHLLAATTTSDGKISYGTLNDGLVDSSSTDIKNIISLPKSVVIPKYGSKEMKMNISVPKDFNKGTILAGVELTNQENREKLNNQVENSYGYLFSVALHHKRAVEETVTIEDSKLKFIDNKTYIETPIINQQVGIQREINVTTIITNKASDEDVESHTKKHLKMAPESTMMYEVPTKRLSAGDYFVQMIVEMSNKKTFKHQTVIRVDESIEQQEVSKVTVAVDNHDLYKQLSMMILLLISCLVVIIVYRKIK